MKLLRVFPVVAVLVAIGVGPALAAGGTVSGKVTVTPAKYLEETVVYLKDAPADHAARAVGLDQKGMKFVPHVLTVTKGDTVMFLNHDKVAHNVFSPDHETYNLGTFKPEEKRTYVFADSTGAYQQLCSIHPEMLGFIFVGANPFSAAVDAQGKFTLKDVPPGTYTIAVWNSKFTAADQSVTVAEGKTAEVSFDVHR